MEARLDGQNEELELVEELVKLSDEDLRKLREQARLLSDQEKVCSMLRSSFRYLGEQLAEQYGMPAGTKVNFQTGVLTPPMEKEEVDG